MKIISTKDAISHGVKMLVYGQAGAGKTRLCATVPNPIIISAESGLLALRDYELPAIEIDSIESLQEVYRWILKSEEANKYESVCIDSISEVAEVILANSKKNVKDPRQAYGELLERTVLLIKSFRDLKGKHIYMSAKMEYTKDESTGMMVFSPSMPGSKLGQQIPYLFDEVFRLGVKKDDEGVHRFLQTQADYQYTAKDRTGSLDAFEQADLTTIINKISRNKGE